MVRYVCSFLKKTEKSDVILLSKALCCKMIHHMFKNILLFLFCSFIIQAALSQSREIPSMKNNQLIVNNKPFLMLAGELHNSSASSTNYMEGVWPKLKSLNLNTVLASVSWDQFEPTEGVFDYSMIDYLIQHAEKHNLKLVVIWFGSWKNGQSSYAPTWVKKDTKRFPRVKAKDGKLTETLSVFSEQSMLADANAFTNLMKRIKQIDKNTTVIMVQPENEVGIFQDIDYSKIALEKYATAVPKQLITYMTSHKNHLTKELTSVWQRAGSKTSGSWKDVFGDTPDAKEFFMAWHYASYINYIATSGRKEHNLPMFVNAWIVQKSDDLPGVYPNGGPVSRVMDIYKAAAPSIDVVCPDIYLPNYKEIYAMYHRRDNPLLVPESSIDPGRAFYAFAEHDAICFSPFGIEDAAGYTLYSKTYAVLNELAPIIAKYQGTGKMKGIHLNKEDQDLEIEIEGSVIRIKIQESEKPAFGLVIKTSEDEFLVAGMNFKVDFQNKKGSTLTYIDKVVEGGFTNGTWYDLRLLNGDETYHHELLRVFGREIPLDANFNIKESNSAVETADQFVYSPGSVNAIITPGIYKVTLYQRKY